MDEDLDTAVSLIKQCRDSRICPLMIQDILTDTLEYLERVEVRLR